MLWHEKKKEKQRKRAEQRLGWEAEGRLWLGGRRQQGRRESVEGSISGMKCLAWQLAISHSGEELRRRLVGIMKRKSGGKPSRGKREAWGRKRQAVSGGKLGRHLCGISGKRQAALEKENGMAQGRRGGFLCCGMWQGSGRKEKGGGRRQAGRRRGGCSAATNMTATAAY